MRASIGCAVRSTTVLGEQMACSLMEGSVWGQTQGGVLSRSRIEPGTLPVFPEVISTDQQKERKRKGRKGGKTCGLRGTLPSPRLASSRMHQSLSISYLCILPYYTVPIYPSARAAEAGALPEGSTPWLFTHLARPSGRQSDSTVILGVHTMLWE